MGMERERGRDREGMKRKEEGVGWGEEKLREKRVGAF